jgi:hypothetical protein
MFSTTPKEPYKNNKNPIKFDPKTTHSKRNKMKIKLEPKKKKNKALLQSTIVLCLKLQSKLKNFKFLREIMNSEIIVLFYLVPELKLCNGVPINLSFLDFLQFHH